MTAPVFTQWSTIEPWLGQAPGWVPEADKIRIQAYGKYEEIYWSSEEGFLQVMRGDNDNPIFEDLFFVVDQEIAGLVHRCLDFGHVVSEVDEPAFWLRSCAAL